MIEQNWTTDRLTVSDSLMKDTPQLQLVMASTADTLRLEGKGEVDPDEMSKKLLQGDLPPNGQKELFRLQTISRKDSSKIIGYLSLYHGYPERDSLYIVTLSIHKDHQGESLGSEIVDQLSHLPGLKNYHTHRLVVTVRNWAAVRFWARHGFTQIVSVHGDILTGDGSGARLELIRCPK